MSGKLYYGDNLSVLRESIATESVDLIYLDPPFNSNANYNVLFKAPSGEHSAAQIEAFEDTWHWNEAAELAFDDVMSGASSDAATLLRAIRSALGENDMMAYLAMMSARLMELHRVLKPTGSLYLHCDPTASHYLKIILDAIFGAKQFRNEIIWKRNNSHSSGKQFGRIHDTILYYTKSKSWTWNWTFGKFSEEQLSRYEADKDGRLFKAENLTADRKNSNSGKFTWRGSTPGITRGWAYNIDQLEKWWNEGLILTKKDGSPRLDGLKVYLDTLEGAKSQSIWTDIPRVANVSNERLGYDTQKPLALLERIMVASSNKGDVVLDPFCGCGTTVHASEKLDRKWLGIDVTHLAIGLVERRLKEAFPSVIYQVHGVPTDAAGARNLAERDKYEFQKWITGKIGAQPYKGGRKGMDRGIDGLLHFRDADKKPQFAVVSVKGGGTKSGDVRDLKGVMDREKASLGIFLTLNSPTREMDKEAASAGFYETGGIKFPRLQILTAAEVIEGAVPRIPFGFAEGFRKATVEPGRRTQSELF